MTIPTLEVDLEPDDDSERLLSAVAWQRAAAIQRLVHSETGAPADGTTVFLRASGRALHVRFICRDRGRWCTHVRRDAPLWEEEVVEVFLAEGPSDPSRYFEFEINPAGALFDAVVDNPDGRRSTMRVDASWNAEGVMTRVAREPESWTAEMAIPWGAITTLRSPPASLRANFFRIERPRDAAARFLAWSPTSADPPDFHKPSCFGLISIG